MATSSILANVRIDDLKKAESFIDAYVDAIENPKVKKYSTSNSLLTAPEEIRRWLSKGNLQRAKRNAEYLAMLDKSFEQLEQGKTISFTMEELEAMEADDWKPTPKVLDFMEKMKN